MKANRLADLQARLKAATADELAEVALNGLVVAWPPTEVMVVFGSDVVTSLDKALDLIGQSRPGWGVAIEGTVWTDEEIRPIRHCSRCPGSPPARPGPTRCPPKPLANRQKLLPV